MKLNMSDQELYDWVLKVVTEFYELVYKDPWFKKIFRNIEQDIITSQQTDFMVQSLGGPKRFAGRMPKDAHPQIWVDEKIWQYREKLLLQAFESEKAPAQLCEQWLKIDEAFKAGILNKAGPEECTLRYRTDEVIYEPMPEHLSRKCG